jgi:predicted DNA-binding ribbon-helix-helix protein
MEFNEMRAVVKRSIIVAGHKTSISLEDAFWDAVREIAVAKGITISSLVASIASGRQHYNLSSCVRLFVLEYYQVRASVSLAARDSDNLHSLRQPSNN